VELKYFYSQSERLSYNPKVGIPGYKWHNRIISFDDRFISVKRHLERLVKEKKQKRLKMLDIGVGDGVYESMLDKRVTKKLDVYGIDISSAQIKRARKYLKEGLVIDVDKKKLPYKDKYFDIVLVSELLEHTFFPENVLKEATRVLKEKGHLVITFPNSGALQLRISLLFYGFSPLLNYSKNKEHIRFFNYRDILKLTDNKLKLLSREGLGFCLFEKWNFQLKIPTLRVMQIIGNKYLPGLSLGNIIIFEK